MKHVRWDKTESPGRRETRTRRLTLERMEDRRLLSVAPAPTAEDYQPVFESGDFLATSDPVFDLAGSAAEPSDSSLSQAGQSDLIDIAPSDPQPIGNPTTPNETPASSDEGGWLDVDICFGAACDADLMCTEAYSANLSAGPSAGEAPARELSAASPFPLASPPENANVHPRLLAEPSSALPPVGRPAERPELSKAPPVSAHKPDGVKVSLHPTWWAPIAPAELAGDREGGLIDVTRVVHRTVYPSGELASDVPSAEGMKPGRAPHQRSADAGENAKIIAPSRGRSQAFEVVSAEAPPTSPSVAELGPVPVPGGWGAVVHAVGPDRSEPAGVPPRASKQPPQESVVPPPGGVSMDSSPQPSASPAPQTVAPNDPASFTAAVSRAIDAVLAAMTPDETAARFGGGGDDRPRLATALPLVAIGFAQYHAVAQQRLNPHEDRPRRS